MSARSRALIATTLALPLALLTACGGDGDAQPSTSTPVACPKEAAPQSTEVTKMTLQVDAKRFNVAYAGSDAGIKAAFPQGFPLAPGSGLSFAGMDSSCNPVFWSLTDRGPNADSPDYKPDAGSTTKSKVFPVPAFAPKLTRLTVKQNQASLLDALDLQASGKAISGLPLPAGTVGSSLETPLTEALAAQLGFDANGMDPEGIAVTPDGKQAWIVDEYGPFLARVELATGKIAEKLAPGAGLPEVIKYRQPNRGAEGVALTPSGKVVMVVQSTLEMPDTTIGSTTYKTSKAPFVRLVEYDPATRKTRMFAYPIDLASYAKAKDAKIGDLVALSDTRFLIVEQGTYAADDKVHNKIYAIDVAKATDLTGKTVAGNLELEYATSVEELTKAGITMARKALALDMNAQGWTAEKLEGLAVTSSNTLYVINDNDFGIKASLTDSTGKSFKPDDCTIDSKGVFSGKKCTGTAPYTYKVGALGAEDQTTQLWKVRVPTDFIKLLD